ncbi:MAG: DUF4239 domain-containing protein, partial [Candidatus Omnitrophica bacterium]|nr:DUF4239 domain-containing protein [Candidatus Omnitrophota bacterium]
MPLTQQLLLRCPYFILGPAIVGLAIAFSITGLLLVRHFFHHSKLKAHHDVADPILGALGTVYAVLLAFVVVTVWQSFDKSNSNVQREANCLADLYRDAEAFPAESRQKIGALLRQYREVIVDSKWKMMAGGRMSPEAESLIRRIWAFYTAYQPKSPAEQSFFDVS